MMYIYTCALWIMVFNLSSLKAKYKLSNIFQALEIEDTILKKFSFLFLLKWNSLSLQKVNQLKLKYIIIRKMSLRIKSFNGF